MKFEIELTEEEAKKVAIGNFHDTNIPDQIHAQLPKAKAWEEKHKFLVGYVFLNSASANHGELNSYPASQCSDYHLLKKVYGFTKAQFVRAVREIRKKHANGDRGAWIGQLAEEFLEKQAAE